MSARDRCPVCGQVAGQKPTAKIIPLPRRDGRETIQVDRVTLAAVLDVLQRIRQQNLVEAP